MLLNAYSRELERRRLAAGAQGLLISGDGMQHVDYDYVSDSNGLEISADDVEGEDDDDDDDEFHYPVSTPVGAGRPTSRASSSVDYFSRPGMSRVPTDLTPQLSQAPDFRVPTHEAPQKILTPRWTSLTPHHAHAQWERDETVHQCRDCQRRFNFLLRRVRTFLSLWHLSCLNPYVACRTLLSKATLYADGSSSTAASAGAFFVTAAPHIGHF